MVGDARNIFEISSIEHREGVKEAVRLTALEGGVGVTPSQVPRPTLRSFKSVGESDQPDQNYLWKF